MHISKSKEKLLPFSEANRLLRYEPSSGKIFWRVNRKRRKAADEAGSISATTGRPIITINKRNYIQSRVAWLLYYGEWPASIVDHKNRDICDTRIENLRLANYVLNGANRIGNPRHLPGSMKGASLSIRRGRKPVWRSSIKIEGKTRNLGSFKTELEAHNAYLSAALIAFGPFARAA